MAAPNFQLDNLTAIIDNNSFQQTGSNKDIMSTADLTKKWKSFNWEVLNIDGHNIDEILAVSYTHLTLPTTPYV